MYAFEQSYFHSSIIIGVGDNIKREIFVLLPTTNPTICYPRGKPACGGLLGVA